LLVTCHSSLVTALAFCLLLAGCSEFERTAYRTLAVTKAEYETIQSRVAEAAAHGLISEEQWNRFSAEGHRFIAAHNAAVDAFELWSRVKSQPNEARVAALLEILPRLVRELNSLAESLAEKPESEATERNDITLSLRSHREEEKSQTLNPKQIPMTQIPNPKLNHRRCSRFGFWIWNFEFV
jgi:methionyl-tRNA synthetase